MDINFFKHNKSRSLSIKIRDVILTITIVSLCLVGIISYGLSRTINIKKQQQTTYSSILNAAYMMDSFENNLVEQFVNICGTEDFTYNVRLLLSEPTDDVLHTRNLQNVLNDLQYASYLVNSSLIVTGDGKKAYTLFSSPLVLSPDIVFPNSEIKKIHEISWLPERNSPLKLSETVIPMVIPLKLIGDYVQVVAREDIDPDLYVVFFIDRTRLLNTLNASNPQEDVTDIYLINESGIPLTAASRLDELQLSNGGNISVMATALRKYIHLDDETVSDSAETEVDYIYEETRPEEVKHYALSTVGKGNDLRHILEYKDASEYIILHELKRPGLYVLAHSKLPTLQDFIIDFSPAFVPIFLVLLSILIAVSIFMSSYITKPLMKLVSIVDKIGKNEYTEKVVFDTEDEVGTLLKAINKMYDINVRQMQQIREDEKENYKQELKILTEQINPHFLYNTLEEIQSEVMRGKKETAGNMIQYLADYLRIGLSGGADQIPISNEIRHAAAYINIMNQRFDQHVMFVHRIDPALSDKSILKTILQPLMENSIRHGFGIDANGIPVSVPTIEVSFTTSGNRDISIELTDNGGGFDPEEVRKIMMAPSHPGVRQHVGINNTWLRLISFYGEENIDIDIESIPYYKNSFLITIKNAY